jgi:hypothetical protein
VTRGKQIFVVISVLLIAIGFGLVFYGYQKSQDKKNSSNTVLSVLQNITNPSGFKPADLSKCDDWKSQNCTKRIRFIQTNDNGEPSLQGRNYAILLDPTSPNLDFKVTVPLSNEIYAKNSEGKLVKNYQSKTFEQLINDQNSLLDGKNPLAAINSDYIDQLNNPQGLNISRGVEYSGDFASLRSSFAISGGEFENRKASIQIGKKPDLNDNFNTVGGNGRFYSNGVFEDICTKLGTYACEESTNRSMAAITNTGKVIFLVHQSDGTGKLVPDKFDDLLEGIAKKFDLGTIQDALLFDGGKSPAIMYDSKIYTQNGGQIGSAFLIYEV